MTTALVIYSSQNGSTENIAKKIEAGLNRNGVETDLVNIDKGGRISKQDYDFYGIGSPVYIFRPSYKIMNALDDLSFLSGKPVFTFVTFGAEIGDGANWLRRKLARGKTIDLGHFQCRGKNLFPGYTSRGYCFSSDSPTTKEQDAAEAFGSDIALKVMSKNFGSPSRCDKPTHFVYRFERFVTNRVLIRYLYSYFFSADKARCNGCGLCVEKCPTQNITMQNEQMPVWGHECVLCCNCQIQCPQQAVNTPLSWFLFTPFMWYNIFKTKRRVPFAKVQVK
jgi:flavodoxin/ferredoxin